MISNSGLKIGIIGVGQFTKFIVPILEKDFEVEVFDRKVVEEIEVGVKDISDLDYLIFSIPLSSFPEVCQKIQNRVAEKTILVDVTSVKVEPLNILKIYFSNGKNSNPILGTHPIFGPQSGKNGIENLTIVLTNVSVEENRYLAIKKYLSENLKLNIIEKGDREHDEEMAFVQGLSHFIGRAISQMEIQEYATATKSYKQLLNLKEMVGSDSWDLYKTIQNGNPSTKEIRKKFLQTLISLEEKLENDTI